MNDVDTMKSAAVKLNQMAADIVDQINLEYGRMKPLDELVDEVDFNEYVEPVYEKYGLYVAQLVVSLVFEQRGRSFGSPVELVNECIRQYRLRSNFTNRIGRFYLYLEPSINEMEVVIEETTATDYFRSQLVKLYQSWLDEMSPEERANLFTYNTQVGGANTNWLLTDEDFSQYTDDLIFDPGIGSYSVPRSLR